MVCELFLKKAVAVEEQQQQKPFTNTQLATKQQPRCARRREKH